MIVDGWSPFVIKLMINSLKNCNDEEKVHAKELKDRAVPPRPHPLLRPLPRRRPLLLPAPPPQKLGVSHHASHPHQGHQPPPLSLRKRFLRITVRLERAEELPRKLPLNIPEEDVRKIPKGHR